VKQPKELPQARCLELLSSFEVGRVALCTDTGPLVWPVNYSMVEDDIVFRTSPHSLLGTMAWNHRLAFEVDRIDLDREDGWSVLATGTGEMVEDPDELALIRTFRDPRPWAGGASRLLYVRLHWVALTGRELV
jgi:nitroimidazol reductase NimA-like FMN-containing flavoprotein (pyridoxamine 5'-phosphate oxidase superfamily)